MTAPIAPLKVRVLSSAADGSSSLLELKVGSACSSGDSATPAVADLVEAPRRLLIVYRANRRASEVSRMLAVAARLRESVDRVVIVAHGGALAAVRAVLSSCLHPYHNELSRGARGGRPRVYFVADSIDNDALQGLLEIVAVDGAQNAPEHAWAILVIAAGDSIAASSVLRLLQERLLNACRGDKQLAAERTCFVAVDDSPFAASLQSQFALTPGLAGAWSLFTPATLLPAAMVGIDIVRLLLGGVVVSQAFLDGAACPARELAALRRDWADAGRQRRTLVSNLRSLANFQAWHDDWLTPTLAPDGSETPHGACQRLVVTAARSRCDALGLVACAANATISAPAPTLGLELPALDEVSLGQLAQTLLLSPLLERLPPS